MDSLKPHKDEIEKQIVDEVVVALESSKITKEDSSAIADFVLAKIDAIQTQEELVVFVTELAQKWPIFENIAVVEKGEAKDKQDDQAVNKVVALAGAGKIDEAIQIAKTATGQ